MEKTRRQCKLVHEGDYLAEVDVDLILTDDGWSPYLSGQDVRKLDAVRLALRAGDVVTASKMAKVYRVTPVSAA